MDVSAAPSIQPRQGTQGSLDTVDAHARARWSNTERNRLTKIRRALRKRGWTYELAHAEAEACVMAERVVAWYQTLRGKDAAANLQRYQTAERKRGQVVRDAFPPRRSTTDPSAALSRRRRSL